MKLGILCTMINGFGRRGFYNTQEIGLGRALARKGNQVAIYKCLKKTGDETIDRIEIEDGLTIFYIPIKGWGAHGYLDTSILDKSLDGLFCFTDNQIFTPHIVRFCKKNGIRFAAYVGTTFSLNSGLHAKVSDTLFAMGTLRIFKKCPIIAKTQGAKRELEELGVKHDIVVAPVGLDVAVLRHDYKDFDKNELRREYGFEPEDTVLCNVSRLESEKRTLDLIDILYRIKDKKRFKLVLVGEGPLREELDARIAQRGLEDRVKIISRVPYEEMWKIYAMSDYFVNMNKGEIFGMAIMEAVYYETSVAAWTAPGPSVTLKDMKGHRLCDSDEEVEAWLTGEYPSEDVLAESSRKMARDFSWDPCADAIIAIMKKQ